MKYFYTLIIALIISTATYAQKHDYNINVYFTPNSFDLIDNRAVVNNISEIRKLSASLKVDLEKEKFKSARRTFPEFSKRDTLVILENGKRIKKMDLTRVFTLSFPNLISAEKAIENLSKNKNVLFAEPDWGVEPTSSIVRSTGDSEVADQWHLNNTGQNGGTPDADMDVFEAWQEYEGDGQVKIAIIDTGVDDDQLDLSGKVTGDLHDPSVNSTCRVAYSHGTHVAGIAAAKKGGGNVRGVSSYSGVISKNLYDGTCNTATQTPGYLGSGTTYNKIMEAINEGASVINYSNSSTSNITLINAAFANAYQYNMINVVSMGNIGNNENQTPTKKEYPAAFAKTPMIQVGYTDRYDLIGNKSRQGNHIDLVAPGEEIISNWTFNNGETAERTGTSYATPGVAGIAALLFEYGLQEKSIYLYNDDVQNLLKLSADKVPAMGSSNFDPAYGYGRANAKKALDRLNSPYILDHYFTTGGSVHNYSFYEYVLFYATPGISDGYHEVDRVEVRKTVSYPTMNEVHVWGRGTASGGYSDDNPNFAYNYTDVINVTNTSATLRTFVYKKNGVWYPTSPSNVSFGYTVHGTLATPTISASISGPSILSSGSNGTWYGSSSDGQSPLQYEWRIAPVGQGGSGTLVGTGSSYSGSQTDDFDLFLTITDSRGYSGTIRKFVDVTGGGCQPGFPCKPIAPGTEQPESFSLEQNYPNPFNPSTEITYALPEAAEVVLKVYNIMGQEVATLINNNMSAGFHSITFDANTLPSGVYIARMDAVGQSGVTFTKELKMQLIK
ncbi:MAG: hypothetical protein CL670_05825 [Balneola sp.]|nr:hypothetical protein [Balneola sp.]MBE78654.1 hypothetical protein [Balneola sp.]